MVAADGDSPGAAGLRGIEAETQRATFLELFLDLVFVFALNRVTQSLAVGFTAGYPMPFDQTGQAVVLFLALWLLWMANAFLTSRLDPETSVVQFVMILTMAGSMVMAVAAPQGFHERALIFAGAYLTVQIGRGLALLVATRGRSGPGNPAPLLRVLIWSGLTAAPWLVGGITDEQGVRAVLWSIALALDYVGLALGWPVPWLGRSQVAGQSIAGERLGERYQQFLLIALGESILTIGITFSGGPGFTRDRTIAFALAMLTTVQFWRIYFYRAGGLLPLAITRAREPVRLGRSASFTHLAMVAGIIVSGVGYELYIDHPLGHTEPGWLAVIIGGPALFLAGRVAFEYQVFGRISRARVAGLLCLGLLIPALLVLPTLAAGAATVAVLFAITVADAYRARGRTSEEPAPPV